MSKFTLADLEKRIHERAKASSTESYTRSLIDKGIAHCAKKLGEEAIETGLAAVQEDKTRLIAEAADLLYHLLVVLEVRGIALAEVEAALEKRTGQTGHEEKASRPRTLKKMEQRTEESLSPYRMFSRAEWAMLREDTPMTLTSEEVTRLRSLHDRLDMAEVEEIYLPLSRLLSMYVAATQRLFRAQQRFLGTEDTKMPYIIGVGGSVAVGKSTTARVLQALLARWPNVPKVDLITTDGFLYPNAVLEREGLMEKKGFPESYDLSALLHFLSAVKAGRRHARAPIYSHLVYDVVPNRWVEVDRPDILIVGGPECIADRPVAEGGQGHSVRVGLFRFFGLSRCGRGDPQSWYVYRFLTFRGTAFRDPKSYFHRYSNLSDKKRPRPQHRSGYESTCSTCTKIFYRPVSGLI